LKPHLLKIPLNPEHSFNVRYDIVPSFYNKWHYHEEVELVYIIKGTGMYFVGDSIDHFKPHDLLMLGSSLPHLWKSDEQFLVPDSEEKVEAIVIHFLPQCFGKNFFSLPENKDLQKLLDQAQQGLKITQQTQKQVSERMHQLLNATKTRRILLLLEILEIIASSQQSEIITTKGFHYHNIPAEIDRLNNIYQHILNNFNKEISLEEIAKIAHITPPAFCRYFKSRTKKTFSRFLLEVRTAHAAKLLAETNKPVADICYESGFNNFSNFNRHFKLINGNTPLVYRKYFR